MKKVLSLLAFACFALVASAQANFHLTPEGFKDDNDKSYIVFEREGSQADLYKRMHAALTSCFKNPKEVLSTSEPESIVISSVYDFGTKMLGQYIPIDSHYSMHIYFKDGKVRFDAPSDTSIKSFSGKCEFIISAGKDAKMAGIVHFYDKNGNPKYEKMAKEYTKHVNGLIEMFMEAFDKGTSASEEEW